MRPEGVEGAYPSTHLPGEGGIWSGHGPGNKPAQAPRPAQVSPNVPGSLGREDLSASLTRGPRRTQTRGGPNMHRACLASLRATHAERGRRELVARQLGVGKGGSRGRLLPSLIEPVVSR